MGYLPYLFRFYAPADARGAFVAVRDSAAHYGAKIIGIPRDNLPVLKKEDGSYLFEANTPWEPVTPYRQSAGAKRAVLAMGATAMLLEKVCGDLKTKGTPIDAYVINGLPITASDLEALVRKYPEGVVTVEDGIIGNEAMGLRGFASLVNGVAGVVKTSARHVGIVDPTVAPSDGHLEVWEHFGITANAVVQAVQGLK